MTTGVTAATRFAAVLGWPVAHSRSPALHNAAFAACGIDAVMIALPVAPSDLATVVRGLASSGCLGASVTVPHKEAVGRLCGRCTPMAERIGAVNCLMFDNGTLVGDNTDADGFVDALREAGLDPSGGRAVVLGGGGAARAVYAGLAAAGAEPLVVARRPEVVRWTAARSWNELAELMDGAALVVDSTSAGLSASSDGALADSVPLTALGSEAAVMSLVYHHRTELLRRAAQRGLRTLDGRGMLVHQGARAFQRWIGVAAPIEVMRGALDASLRPAD